MNTYCNKVPGSTAYHENNTVYTKSVNDMIKAIFSDVDGTLLSFDTHCVPPSAIKALQEVHDSGVKIIIATGRSFTDLHEIEDIPYDAVVAMNGSLCALRNGKRISRQRIALCDFHKAQQLARSYDFALGVETDRCMMVDRITPAVIELARLVNHPVPPVGDIEKEFTEGECCKLNFFCDTKTEQEVMTQLPGLSASRWNPIFADVNVAGTDKGTGIHVFADYYGFDVSETIAFGDGGNDISMIRVAGTGVAMGNASEIVKQAADYVTDAVDEDGIRNALEHLGIISISR